MILPLAFAERAAAGRATVALIPVRLPHTTRRTGPVGRRRTGRAATYTTRPWSPQTGRSEPLLSRTARTTEQVGTVIIGEHRTIWLSQLLYDDPQCLELVKQTGCKSRSDFADRWMRHYDPEWPELVEELCPKCGGHKKTLNGLECHACDPVGVILIEQKQTPADVVDRFRRRHGETEVHVVHFTLDYNDTRFLSPTSRHRGDDHGYTTTRDILDAGTAVPLQFQVELSRDAFERDDQARREQLDLGDLIGTSQGERDRRRARNRRAA